MHKIGIIGCGIMASRIAQAATEEAMQTRKQPRLASRDVASNVHLDPDEVPLDAMDLPISSPTTRGEGSQ